jgi:hypothetical protein
LGKDQESAMLRSTMVILLLTLSASASAEDFDYTFLAAGYGVVNFDAINADGDGFNLGGSYAINSDYHVFFDYQGASLDSGVDASSFGAGFAYNRGLSPQVDFVASLSYEYREFGSADDTGLGVGLGLRFAASDVLELNAGIKLYNFDNNDTGFALAALYDVNEQFSVGVSGDWTDDISTFSLVGRMYFGR